MLAQKTTIYMGDMTHPFVNIPTAALAALCSLGHPLVCLEVPVEMSRFLLFSFLVGVESTTTSSAFITLGVVESVDQYGPRTGHS